MDAAEAATTTREKPKLILDYVNSTALCALDSCLRPFSARGPNR